MKHTPPAGLPATKLLSAKKKAPAKKAVTKKAPAESAPAAKKAPAPKKAAAESATPSAGKQVLAKDTIVVFKKYEGPPPENALKAGQRLAIGHYFPDRDMYNVHELGKKDKPKSDAVDTLMPEEFAVEAGEQELPLGDTSSDTSGGVEVHVEDGQERKAGGKKKAVAKKTTDKKQKQKEQEQEDNTPVKILPSVQQAIKESNNDVLAAAATFYERSQASYITMGGLLCVARERNAHTKILDKDNNPVYPEGHKGFDKYVEKTLGLKPRKAAYWMDIYRTFSKTGVSESKLTKIGWTRLKEITDYINQDGDVEEALDMASKMTTAELRAGIQQKMVDANMRQHGSRKDKANMTGFRFTLHNDQAAAFNAGLKKVAEDAGLEDPIDNPEQLGPAIYAMFQAWQTQTGFVYEEGGDDNAE